MNDMCAEWVPGGEESKTGMGADAITEDGRERKRLIRTLRFLLLLGVVGVSFAEAQKGTLPWQFWFAGVLYFLSNIVYHFEPTDIFKSFRVSAFFFLFDGAVVTYMMFVTGGGADIFVLLAVILLISAIPRNVGAAFFTTVAVGSFYTLMSVNNVRGVAPFLSMEFLIHVALFFILSLFVTYFARETDRVRNAAKVRLEVARDRRDALENLVRERTTALKARSEELIGRLVTAAEFRDNDTPQHLQRMSAYCGLIARKLGMDVERADHIRVASIMHDIGKIGIPEGILMKPGALTPREAEIMKLHTEIGHRILAGSDSELLQIAAQVAWTHHERLDGRGFPRGLRWEAIPIEGRIAAVADEFETLTSRGNNRELVPVGEAFGILRDGAGVLYDREVVRAFLEVRTEALEIRSRYIDQLEGPKARLLAILRSVAELAQPSEEE